MKKLTLVGMFQSVSKKGDAFAIAYFTGDPDDKIKDKCVGVVGYKFFVMGENLSVLKGVKIGSQVNAYLNTYKNEKGEYITTLVAVTL